MTGKKPLRILHVDDEENQLEFTKLFLEQIDKDVIIDSVSDPEEALKRQEEENYDCIVSDYKMMSMNGIELAQKVREKSDVPFILYTGQGSEEVAEQAFTAGVDDYLRKESEPTHYQVLAKRIKHTVEKHRTDELYRKVVEESRDAILIVVDNKIAFLNQAACKLFSLEKVEEAIGRDISEFFQDEAESMFSPPTGEINYILKRGYKTKSGSVRSAEVNISKINYRGDEAYLCFIRDITERKRNEERLDAIYQQVTRLSSVSSNQEISEITLDIMESVFGYHTITFHLVEGSRMLTLGTRGVHSIDFDLSLTDPGIITKSARDGQSILVNDFDRVSETDKGNTKARSGLAVPAILDGEVVAVLNVESNEVNDFTEDDRKLLETLTHHVAFAFNRIKKPSKYQSEGAEKKRRLNYALGVLDNAEKVTTLVGSDLQRNLLSILNATGILRIKPEMLPRLIETINANADEAQNISNIIREILAKSTIIEGVIEANRSIRNLIETFHFPRNIRLNTQYDENLIIIEIEEEKFRRIMNNLLSNAVEAMPDGGSLSVKLTAKEDVAYIDVEDTGSGIPESQLNTIFSPFNTTKEGHSGLGLAFCKNAAESVGGSINIKSTDDDGTTFRLIFPIRNLM
jgi:PAS domain S-box-containing protein